MVKKAKAFELRKLLQYTRKDYFQFRISKCSNNFRVCKGQRVTDLVFIKSFKMGDVGNL